MLILMLFQFRALTQHSNLTKYWLIITLLSPETETHKKFIIFYFKNDSAHDAMLLFARYTHLDSLVAHTCRRQHIDRYKILK